MAGAHNRWSPMRLYRMEEKMRLTRWMAWGMTASALAITACSGAEAGPAVAAAQAVNDDPAGMAHLGLIREALEVSKEYAKGKNDMPVFASRFEGVTTLARHSLSHAVRRILNDKNYNENLAKFTPHDLRRTDLTVLTRGELRLRRVLVTASCGGRGGCPR